ncbi:unnamed protein product [Linum tenue]|uniref:Cytochrome P450 n=1 Tax=Linum tenue TaxID=586396 RepID=A0AAV0NCZ8_9ROSI|nr:unnamed protein product [Linum tenue]
MPLLLLLITSFLSLLLLYTIITIRKKSSSSSLPNWPFLGMLPSLLWNLSNLHDFATRILKAHGGTFAFKGPSFTNLDFIVTSDPANVHHIVTKNFSNYPKGPELKAIMEPFGEVIFNTDGDSWKTKKDIILSLIKTAGFERLLMTTLRHKLADSLIPVLDHAARNHDDVVLDMQDVMKRFTFDLTCLLLLGIDTECLSTSFPRVPCAEAFDVIEEAIVYRHCVPPWVWKLQRWLHVGWEGRTIEAEECLNRFLEERIRVKMEEKRAKESCGNDDGDDNYDLLMKLMVETERLMGDCYNSKGEKFVRETVVSLMVAGRDTIAVALSWFFWLVATNPGVEEKILEELDRHVITQTGEEQGIFSSIEELNKMVYLHGAISETLRLYPSVPNEPKQSMGADVLPSGHAVGKNTRILVSIYSMGRMEEVWGKDWMEFKPERWVSERTEGNNISNDDDDANKKKICTIHVPSYKFAAFLAGPRSCPGRKIAFMQLKNIASCVLRRYKIVVVDDHPVLPLPSIMMFMKYGLKVRVLSRKPENK